MEVTEHGARKDQDGAVDREKRWESRIRVPLNPKADAGGRTWAGWRTLR